MRQGVESVAKGARDAVKSSSKTKPEDNEPTSSDEAVDLELGTSVDALAQADGRTIPSPVAQQLRQGATPRTPNSVAQSPATSKDSSAGLSIGAKTE